MYQCQDITVQWCILAEALFRSQHPKGFHSMGILIGGNQTDRVSLHHCLLANNGQRNPRLQGGLMDVRNNVIYNWGTSGGYFTNETRVNCVGNLYLPGPDTRHRRKSLLIGPDVNMFLRDTVLVDGDARVSDWDLVALKAERPPARAERPFPAPEVSTRPSDQVYEAVLSGAGATVPVRDAVDVTLIKRVRERTGRLIDSSGR
jgi:pectate lyase